MPGSRIGPDELTHTPHTPNAAHIAGIAIVAYKYILNFFVLPDSIQGFRHVVVVCMAFLSTAPPAWPSLAEHGRA
jgi:hypothetical protein